MKHMERFVILNQIELLVIVVKGVTLAYYLTVHTVMRIEPNDKNNQR